MKFKVKMCTVFKMYVIILFKFDSIIERTYSYTHKEHIKRKSSPSSDMDNYMKKLVQYIVHNHPL